MKRILLASLVGCLPLLFATSATAQFKKHYMPAPLKVFIPFEGAWEGMLATLREKVKLPTAEVDRTAGLIVTDFREYSSGPLTKDHIDKIGNRPGLPDGDWKQVRYRYEINVQLIQEKESVVTVAAEIQALKRSFLGEESWVAIPSRGNLEATLLTEYGRQLFGDTFALASPKKGFWEQDPSYVADPSQQINVPRTAAPERPPR